ncbi:MAG: phage terminase small subunit P27 family [Desulfobacterales bacterium]|nr:MAG: phage terminase small subunit P27 family [Desulfobacterales bacterium]
MAGRKPLPDNIKQLKGTLQKCRQNKNPVKISARMLEPPDSLDAAGVQEWNRVAPILFDLGLLTEIDKVALEAYCNSYARWLEAEKNVKEEGMVIKAANGIEMQNPYLTVAQKCIKEMQSWLAEFGMTPGCRSKVSTAPRGNNSKWK